MQGECRTSSLFGCYAEPPLILCKDNANRMHNEKNVFISYAEVQLILCKDNAYFSKRCILYGLCNDFIITIKIGTADFFGLWQEIITF